MTLDLVLGKIFADKELDEADWAALQIGDPEAWKSGISAWRNRRNGEENPWQIQLQQAVAERDDWQKKFQELHRRNRIAEMARISGCEEAEYLDFLAQKSGLDLEDATAVENFLAQLRETHPGCFVSQLQSGGGSGLADPAEAERTPVASAPHHQLDYLIQSLGNVPFEE